MSNSAFEHQQQEGIWPWSGIFHHTQFYWSGIDFCLRQETSEEDTEADESFVSTDAEGIPHHEETRGCEADVNKDQDVDQQGVTDEDVEEVSKEVRGEAMEAIETGSDEEETETRSLEEEEEEEVKEGENEEEELENVVEESGNEEAKAEDGVERDTQEEIQEVEGDIFEEEDMNVSIAFVSARPRMETLEQV